MCQHVIGANELAAPVKLVKNFSLLCNEIVVREGHTALTFNVFDKLLDTRVGHLVILGRNEDTDCCDQGKYFGLRLASEISKALNVLFNVVHL